MADDVLKLLRRARRANPETFELAVRQYLEIGEDALQGRGPGREAVIDDNTLALLLADIENAKADGLGPTKRLKELADRGCRYGPVHFWYNVNTIKTHLKQARHLAATDSEFAEQVVFYRWALRVLG